MDNMLEQLKVYLDPSREWASADEQQLTILLRFSGAKILTTAFPFNATITAVPARYALLQIRIAAELYAKMGAEGQLSHAENGISRAWESADVARSLLSEITPCAGVFGGG